MAIDMEKVDEILDAHGLEQRALIPALLEIQDAIHYLPHEVLLHVAERMKVPLIQIHQVAKFYKVFSLEPRGKYIITVCQGTACHVQGGNRLVDQIERVLDITPGQTTKDMQFTLESVNCLGCCALGPVMTIGGKYYGNMVANKVEGVLEKYMVKEASPNG